MVLLDVFFGSALVRNFPLFKSEIGLYLIWISIGSFLAAAVSNLAGFALAAGSTGAVGTCTVRVGTFLAAAVSNLAGLTLAAGSAGTVGACAISVQAFLRVVGFDHYFFDRNLN